MPGKIIAAFIWVGFLSTANATNIGPAEYTIAERLIEQPLDHTNTTSRKFNERVTILVPSNTTPASPVFFILGNEYIAGQAELLKIYDIYKSGTPMIFVLAEHRGYGVSISDEDQTLPTYVTVQQALADYHDVVTILKQEFTGSWIGAGWSYSGSLVLQHAQTYKDDFKAILSSSSPIRFPITQTYYDEQTRKFFGADTYKLLAEHIKNLEPNDLFDQNWQNREMILSMVRGFTQYAEYGALKPMFEKAALQSTGDFVNTLKVLDQKYAGGMAWNVVEGFSKRSLSKVEALSGRYTFRLWRYQQCTVVGSFDMSFGGDGIYNRTESEYLNECKALFGNQIEFPFKEEWNPLKSVLDLQVPVVYVAGGQDPWYVPGIPKDSVFPNGKYYFIASGLHCPDRVDLNLAAQIKGDLLTAVGGTYYRIRETQF